MRSNPDFSTPKVRNIFAYFAKCRQRTTLGELIKRRNDYAKSYAENGDYSDSQAVLAYMYPCSGKKAQLFIDIEADGTYTLAIANVIQSAANDEELEALERSLFEWAWDEGYFDDVLFEEGLINDSQEDA